jgi:hypothetical protein
VKNISATAADIVVRRKFIFRSPIGHADYLALSVSRSFTSTRAAGATAIRPVNYSAR